MGDVVPVDAGGTSFYVEVSGHAGPTTVALDKALSFTGVRETITAIAGELAGAWESVRPDEAEVAFGLKVTAKSGRLTGLLVEGGGEASLMVTLKWTGGTSGPVTR